MADAHKEKGGGCGGFGYAPFGHWNVWRKSDRSICGGSGAADSVLCGTDRERKYTAAADGGDCRGKAAGSEIRQAEEAGSGGICPAAGEMDAEGSVIPGGDKTAGDFSGYISQVVKKYV